MIGLSTLPVVLITWVATTNTRRAVERELVGANVTRVNWAAGYLDELLRTLDALFYAVQIDPELAPLLTTLENDGPAESELARREIARLLSGSYYAHSRVVDEVQLYVRATGTAISVDNVSSGRIHSPDAAAGPWRGILDGPVPLLLQRVGDAIYAVHSINRFMDQSLRGAIAVRLDDGIEARIAGILASGGQDSIHVLNERGEPLISVSAGADADGRADSLSDLAAVVSALPPVTSSTTVRRTEDELVFARRVDRGRLTVAKRVPRWVIRRSARGTVTAGVLTGSAVAALSVVLAILFSLRISRPIVGLAQSMEAATVPDFGKLNIQSRDEVKLLEDGYRSLMSQMKALAHREYLQEIELKDARLAALQAQINPHFLNNTLNLLGGMALAKGAQEVYKIARAIL